MHYKDTPLIFLDLETTGSHFSKDRVIEVYASKVLNGEVIGEFHSLFNPGFTPDPFILRLTNIKKEELFTAPQFGDLAEDLFNFVKDDLIIAHNARFDYGFLKSEFGNLGFDLKSSYCCSVKLSRFLYPKYQRHNLDSIIARFQIEAGERHRAKYDAEAIRIMFYKAIEENGEEIFLRAFTKSIKSAAIPTTLLKFDFNKLPESPGIYIFETTLDNKEKGNNDKDYRQKNIDESSGIKAPLYVGMSKNIKTRILQHLYSDYSSSKEFKVNSQVKDIRTIETAGVLGAYLRESYLIKNLMPLYNRALRRNSSLAKLTKKVDDKGYIHIDVERDSNVNVDELQNLIGVFENVSGTKDILRDIASEYNLCKKFLGLEKGKGACFSYQLGNCSGACIGKISALEHNKEVESAFKRLSIQKWPFENAIIIREVSSIKTEEFLVYNWCLIGSTLGEGQAVDINGFSFNLDTYKILRRFLRSKEYFEIEEIKLNDIDWKRFRSLF